MRKTLNLERRRASNNTIKQIRPEQGIVVKDLNDILLETRRYYDKLYTKDISINNVVNKLDNFLNDSTLNMLIEDEKEMCDAPLHLEKLEAALNLLKSDSSPGSDGITPGFYKVFWQRLKALLFNSL